MVALICKNALRWCKSG